MPLALAVAAAAVLAARFHEEAPPPRPKPPSHPKVARGWAGFEIEDVPGGVRLVSVFPESPAEKAGLEAGDVLTRVGTAAATSSSVFQSIVAAEVGTAIVFERTKASGEKDRVSVTVELASGTEALLARTIRKGAAGLAALERDDGLFREDERASRFGVAASALACAALAAAGEDAGEPGKKALERGLAALLPRRGEDGGVGDPRGGVLQHRVYANALLLLALASHAKNQGRGEHGKELAEARGWLASSQIAENRVDPLDFRWGGFPYYEGGGTSTLRADVSVTAWALEALAASGLDEARPEWARAERFLDRCQNREVRSRDQAARAREAPFRDGGFGFTPRASKAGLVFPTDAPGGSFKYVGVSADALVIPKSYGSATADGARALLACSRRDFRDERADAALRWLARSFTVERNPGFEGDAVGWGRGLHIYWLCSLSRALDAARVDRIASPSGERSWPAEIARLLANSQDRKTGTWASASGLMGEDSPVVATSLALLALAAARDRLLAKDGRVLEGGEGPAPPPPELAPWEPTASQDVLGRGLATFRKLGCASCHEDGSARNGPSLVGVADRYLERKRTHDEAASYLNRHIRDPQRFPGLNGREWGERRMPGFGKESGLESEDMACLVEFLLSRSGELPVSEARTPR